MKGLSAVDYYGRLVANARQTPAIPWPSHGLPFMYTDANINVIISMMEIHKNCWFFIRNTKLEMCVFVSRPMKYLLLKKTWRSRWFLWMYSSNVIPYLNFLGNFFFLIEMCRGIPWRPMYIFTDYAINGFINDYIDCDEICSCYLVYPSQPMVERFRVDMYTKHSMAIWKVILNIYAKFPQILP